MEGKEEKFYKLSKAIYGLKDVPRTWYNRIDDYLISFGFDKSLLESAPYVKSKGVEWRLSKARMNFFFFFEDLFTKPLPANKFEFLSQKIGIYSSKNQGGVLDIVFFVTEYKCT